MTFNLSFFLAALGLALVLESLPYFLWAEKMPKVLRLLSASPPARLRILGAVAMGIGLLLILLGTRR